MDNTITSSVRTGRRTPKAPTRKVHWLREQLPNAEDQRDYARERCIVAITEAIGEAMQQAGLSRAQVAKKLEVSRSHITKLLSGEQNMTLHSLADLLWACDAEIVDLDLVEFGVVEVAIEDAEEWVDDDVATIPITSAAS